MATDNTKLENGVQEEQKNTTAHTIGYEAKSVIDKLNENAKAIIAEQEVISKKKFKFNKGTSTKYDVQMYLKAEAIKNALKKRNYYVFLEENLDMKKIDIKKPDSSKYMIRISDKNGCYVEFPYFEYRNIMLDFELSERDYIYNCLVQMAGSDRNYTREKDVTKRQYSELTEAADIICEYLAIICHFKELQTKVYSTIGWDKYNDELIFKYDKIYSTNSLIDHAFINKLDMLNNIEIEDDILEESDKKLFNSPDDILHNYLLKYNASQVNSRCTMDIVNALSCDTDEEWIDPNTILYEDEDEIDKLCSERDNLVGWVDYLATIMNYSPKSALIISAATTGLVRQLLPYTKESNINMNIVGQPAHGKSIICHFALSLFGDPRELEGSFVDSDVAMELNRVKRPVIPYVLDERMLKIEDSSDKIKKQTLLMEIFREYEGKAKEKTAGKGAELSGARTYSPIISSSVDRMMDIIIQNSRDLGQYRRFIEIELKDKKDLFVDAQMAELTETVAYSQYGYGIKLLVPYILRKMAEDGGYVTKLYADITDEISEKLKLAKDKTGLKNLESSAKRFGLILTSLKILIDAVEELEDTKLKINSTLVEDIYNLLEENLIDKMAKASNKNYNENFAANLHAFINRFEDKGIFKTDKVVAWKKASLQGIFGILVKNDKEKTVELITPTASRYAWVALLGYKLKEEQIKEYISAVEESKGIGKKEEKEKVIADAYRKLGLNQEILTDDNKFKELTNDIDKNITVRIVPNGGVIVGDKKNSGGQELTCLKINVAEDYKDSDNKKED